MEVVVVHVSKTENKIIDLVDDNKHTRAFSANAYKYGGGEANEEVLYYCC
jgi:hypothetical protein